MLAKKYFIALLIFFYIPFIIYSQSVTDTVSWGGGWCSLCGGSTGNYACTCSWGICYWENGQKSFYDSIPAGNIVTSVRVTVYYANCGLNLMTIKLNSVTIGTASAPGNCNCGSCFTLTVSRTDTCGFPSYNYGGTNTIKLVPDGQVCVKMAVITLNYGTPPLISLSASTIDVSCNGGNNGSVDLMVTGGITPLSYNWSTGDTTEDIANLLAGT